MHCRFKRARRARLNVLVLFDNDGRADRQQLSSPLGNHGCGESCRDHGVSTQRFRLCHHTINTLLTALGSQLGVFVDLTTDQGMFTASVPSGANGITASRRLRNSGVNIFSMASASAPSRLSRLKPMAFFDSSCAPALVVMIKMTFRKILLFHLMNTGVVLV